MNTNIQAHISHYNPVYTPPPMFVHSILKVLTQICINLPTHLPSCGFLPNVCGYCCTYKFYTSSQSQPLPLIRINDTVLKRIFMKHSMKLIWNVITQIQTQETSSYLLIWLNIQHLYYDSFWDVYFFLGYSHIWREDPPPKYIKQNANHWNTMFSEKYMLWYANESSVMQTEKVPNRFIKWCSRLALRCLVWISAVVPWAIRVGRLWGVLVFISFSRQMPGQYLNLTMPTSFHTCLSASFMILPTILCYTLQNSFYHLMLETPSFWPYQKVNEKEGQVGGRQ